MKRDFINSKVILLEGENKYVNFPCECILTNYEVSTKGDLIWAVFQKKRKMDHVHALLELDFPPLLFNN
jgi:hypothetical protein